MIDKSTWTLVNQLSVNGNAWEGETTAFWDDVVIPLRQIQIIVILLFGEIKMEEH